MAERPKIEFGRRRPAAIEPAAPVKRSGHVALLVMGTLAVGGGAYALMPHQNCQPTPPGMAAPSGPQANCTPRGSSSGGRGYWGSSSRSSFFSSDSASGRTSAATTSEASSAGVTRGGFGSFARAFSAHFSGG
jgi:hypothetical protein